MVEVSEARRRARESGKPMRNEWGLALRPLSPATINKTIDTLQWVLSVAVDTATSPRTPRRANAAACGRRAPPRSTSTPLRRSRRCSRRQPSSTATALVHRHRRAIIATLLLAGPRAGELCNLRWRDIDLADGRISIGRSKTQAGLREIVLLPLLRDNLSAHKARAYRGGPDALVFPTGTGGRRDKDNLRARVLAPTFERADELLEPAARCRYHGVSPPTSCAMPSPRS